MIGRIWRGSTRPQDADAYLEYLETTGLKDYRETPGNRGVIVLRRIGSDAAEFLLLSLWEDLEAVRRFAGPEPERAVYYPADEQYLLDKEPNVTHYEVAAGALEAAASAPSSDETTRTA